MARQPETRLQQKIQKALKSEFPNSFWFKMWGGPFTMAGLPDLIGCVKGYFFAFEVKRPIKSSKPSKIQEVMIERINKAGGCARIVRSEEEAIEQVKARLDGV